MPPLFMLLLATALVALGALRPAQGPAYALAALSSPRSGGHREDAAALHGRSVGASRRARRRRWLAATSRPNDVFFGYEPLYLEAPP